MKPPAWLSELLKYFLALLFIGIIGAAFLELVWVLIVAAEWWILRYFG